MDDQFRPNDPDTADHLDNLANIYEEQAKFKEAEPPRKRALAIREKAFGKLSVPVSDSLPVWLVFTKRKSELRKPSGFTGRLWQFAKRL